MTILEFEHRAARMPALPFNVTETYWAGVAGARLMMLLFMCAAGQLEAAGRLPAPPGAAGSAVGEDQ